MSAEEYDAVVVFRGRGEEEMAMPRGIVAAKAVVSTEKAKLVAVRGLDWRLEELEDSLD